MLSDGFLDLPGCSNGRNVAWKSSSTRQSTKDDSYIILRWQLQTTCLSGIENTQEPFLVTIL
ncbi:hypothetical protein BGX38DRAFT_907719 [Terfezia claveryi]|nr:hypothetical protein BGX38DRAFT_907719 [Terfezia claveryi]